MPAPKGNKFWELRSKHGRDKLFKTPELLWKAACEYFQWVLDNPLYEVDFRGKDADRVELPHTRPFTIQGFVLYCDASVNFFNTFEESLKGKKDKLSKDFLLICTRIRQTIYKQKLEGAACGFYNANIIARDLGLVEKAESEVKHSGTVTNLVSKPMTKKELRDFNSILEQDV